MVQVWEEITTAQFSLRMVEIELLGLGYARTSIPQQFRKEGAIDAYTRLRGDGRWVARRLTLKAAA